MVLFGALYKIFLSIFSCMNKIPVFDDVSYFDFCLVITITSILVSALVPIVRSHTFRAGTANDSKRSARRKGSDDE